MSDDVYRKQLESFGIESIRITNEDINRKRRKEQIEATDAVIKALMERIEGRQWLYSLLDICKVFSSPFTPGQPDVTAFFAGAQAIGHLFLADIMRAAPEQFFAMISEEAARKKNLETPKV